MKHSDKRKLARRIRTRHEMMEGIEHKTMFNSKEWIQKKDARLLKDARVRAETKERQKKRNLIKADNQQYRERQAEARRNLKSN